MGAEGGLLEGAGHHVVLGYSLDLLRVFHLRLPEHSSLNPALVSLEVHSLAQALEGLGEDVLVTEDVLALAQDLRPDLVLFYLKAIELGDGEGVSGCLIIARPALAVPTWTASALAPAL